MYHPTTRVLTVLELLQSRLSITGTELAERLEVDVRTVRRYITMLEELGIPVTADRGRYGGYRLMPGFKLPPLVFNEDEALALTLGLLAARKLGLAAHAPGVEGALAKVERVSPETVRRRVRAVEETLIWDFRDQIENRPDASLVLTLSMAAREQRRVAMRYRRDGGHETERQFDPYGLVCRRGLWYTIGHCHLRGGTRLFRLDRVANATALEEGFLRPEGFDALSEVLISLGSVPRHFPLEVVLDATPEHVRSRISAEMAVLEELPDGRVLLRGYTHNPDWMARMLASLGCPLDIRQPPELRQSLRRHAEEIIHWLEGGQNE
jgi:predicted DNA-binding transcriptional regulator YafY